MCAFAASDLSNEVGGWLIGKWREDRKLMRQFVVIENILPAKHTRQGSAFLTFTHDSQVTLLNNMDSYFPGKDPGWMVPYTSAYGHILFQYGCLAS